MRQRTFIVVYAIAALIVSYIFIPKDAFAQLSSSNFRITSDSLNCGGGQSSSTSFSVFSTICEPADARTLTSTSFVAESGFQYMDDTPFISVSLLDSTGASAKNSITFSSTLTPTGGTITDTILVRVRTNAPNGYTGTVLSDGDLRSGSNTIAAVGDGSIDGSSTSGEYGFAVSSSDTSNCTRPSGDVAVATSGTNFANCTTWKALSDNTLTFKATAGTANQSGSYAQSITVVVTGSF